MLLFYYSQITSGNTNPALIKDYVAVEALVMQVNPQIAQGIVREESNYNCDADGDHGTSHGCWQIHLPAHQDISKEQAHNIIWSTQWSLREIKENGCDIWSTCKKVMKTLASP